MAKNPKPDMLINLFDELIETQAVLETRVYKDHLMRLGMKESKAEILCDLIDPERRGEVTRSDVCVALKCWPNQQAILKDINVLETDMPAMKRNSIIHLILESKLQNKTKKGALDKVKEQLDQIYGPSWNCYIAEKNYWFVCSHRPGSNLAFTYKGYVYGIYQTFGA
uniref:Dynein light chain n=2 Tax=Mesocestoides corti TaxID=53468 RepID=A0A5K3ENW6_MESCO